MQKFGEEQIPFKQGFSQCGIHLNASKLSKTYPWRHEHIFGPLHIPFKHDLSHDAKHFEPVLSNSHPPFGHSHFSGPTHFPFKQPLKVKDLFRSLHQQVF